MKYFKYAYLLLALFCLEATAQKSKKAKTSDPNVSSNLLLNEGFIDYSLDTATYQIYFHIARLNEEMIYLPSLSTGVGSNDIGLDRGLLGREKLVKFVKAGQKLLLVEPNYYFRAISNNPAEIRAVDEAFAKSVLWSFEIEQANDGVYTVDATSFVVRDAMNVSRQLADSKQGNYSLDVSRSALNPDRIKNFPSNTEMDALLTFTGRPTGEWITSVMSSPEAVTLHVHHSFVALPDDNYKPRKFDPRAGFYGIEYFDYATPIGEPLAKKMMSRHRLVKKDPNAAVSEAVAPIVYYLDRGAPEPIRSALLEGASWWNQAFEAAGFKDAFQVRLLPEGVDPMDARYNVIQWVHRSTRGWSYGTGITDPRTGEIIKGHVNLGSLRVRQDYLIAEGLLSPYADESEISDVMEKMSLARLRQLSAHEVGHTLGLAHSYASSAEGRASVMDYPHPKIDLVDGKISLDQAYDNKIGAWDKVAIAYGYSHFPESTDEQQALSQIITDGLHQGLTFLSDQDARPQGGSHPYAHLWDNGVNPGKELDHLMQVRQMALQQMGENSIRKGHPYAHLEEVLVPMYFLHRYQVEATVKLIGGRNYRYALKGDGQPVTEAIAPEVQIQALQSLLRTIEPSALALPEALLNIIPPRPLHEARTNELIPLRTAPNFDPLSAAESAVDMTFALLLHPQRAARLVEYHGRDAKQPGLDQVLNQLIEATWKQAPLPGYLGEIQHLTNLNLLTQLMGLATDDDTSPQVNALAYQAIEQVKKLITAPGRTGYATGTMANRQYALRQIEKFYDQPSSFKIKRAEALPAGSPIGMGKRCEF